MITTANILLVLKYIIAICILCCIVITPIYVCAANECSKIKSARIRFGTFLFSWTFIGWFVSLFMSAKK